MATDKIDLKNLDKSDWKTYRFDEIAINISERVDPNNTDLEVYVGLEHIDSGSLHIKRFGTPDDVNGQKLKFYKGDIIFGRRRAYQRKAGIAPCDGFCSAHALVLRANPDVISPELFPFFLHSDLFMNRAVDISVGSLSPTINWKNLKGQEFLIPPIEKQKVLSKLFCGIDILVTGRTELCRQIQVLYNSTENKYFNDESYIVSPVLDVADVQRGKFSHRPRNAPEFYGGAIPFIQTAEVVSCNKLITSFSQTLSELGLTVSKMFPAGTIVMTIAANIGYVGILDFESAFPDSLVGIKANENILTQGYLFHFLSFSRLKLESLATESAQKNLSIDSFKRFKVHYPKSIEKQNEITSQLNTIAEKSDNAQAALKTVKTLQTTLINQVF